MAGFCARTVPCAEAYRQPFSYEQAVQGTAGISGQPFYVPLLCADLYAVKHGASPTEKPCRYYNRSRFPGDGIIAEKGWSCLNGVKQVFNFRSGSLVCYPTSGRMCIMKADRHTCMPLKKKRRILLKISDTLPAWNAAGRMSSFSPCCPPRTFAPHSSSSKYKNGPLFIYHKNRPSRLLHTEKTDRLAYIFLPGSQNC